MPFPTSHPTPADRRTSAFGDPGTDGADLDHASADALAMRYGKLYRGAGVGLGAIGFLIVLFTILPLALNLPEVLQEAAALGECMALVIGGLVVWCISRADWKGLWIAYRRHAELRRYDWLSSAERHVVAIVRDSNAPPVPDDFGERLRHLLNEQIAYNQRKAARYGVIESRSKAIGLGAYLLALAGSLAHLA